MLCRQCRNVQCHDVYSCYVNNQPCFECDKTILTPKNQSILQGLVVHYIGFVCWLWFCYSCHLAIGILCIKVPGIQIVSHLFYWGLVKSTISPLDLWTLLGSNTRDKQWILIWIPGTNAQFQGTIWKPNCLDLGVTHNHVVRNLTSFLPWMVHFRFINWPLFHVFISLEGFSK